MNNGKFLADGLQRYEHLFGLFFINIVRVGESSGTLAKNLLYLADELGRQKELQSKVRSAMIYPLVILDRDDRRCGIPHVLRLPEAYSGLRQHERPASRHDARSCLHVLSFLRNYGLYALGGLIVFIIVVRAYLQESDADPLFF